MPRPYQAIALLLVLAGCGSTQPYPDLRDKNLQVRTTAQGSAVVMGVHRLDEKCFAHHEGVVTLDRPVIDVGLPPGRLSLLVFDFYSTSLFSGSRSLKREAKITPRAGYRYEAIVIYKDSLYSVDLFEIDPRTGSKRELDTRRGC
jgi:hypothetical protein